MCVSTHDHDALYVYTALPYDITFFICICTTVQQQVINSNIIRQQVPLFIHSSFAAVQVSFAQQSYTVTEGDIVNITLHLNCSHEIDFTVTLQHINESVTGESTACGGNVCEGILQ